jgi:RNA polymerase sigma-70 factor (ECF subfamily)
MTSGLEHRQTPAHAPGIFPATRWSRVVKARDAGDDAQRRAALDELCTAYWRPVVNFLTALGAGQDAADVAQDFFTCFLRLDGFARADPDLGRLRALLKTSVRNHYFHWCRDQAALRRGGGTEPKSLEDDTALRVRDTSDADAEASYDRDWAFTVLERALGKLREDYAVRDRLALFEALKPALLSVGHRIPEEAAARTGLTPNALTVEQHRARRRLAALLRAEVAETVSEPAEVQAELMHLLRLLAQE